MDSSFIVCCEMGVGNFTVDRYSTETEARKAAKEYWVNWVIFRSSNNGVSLDEVSSGGVGFSCPNIRKYAASHIKAKARDVDARAGAAAAAEARMAKMNAQQPKPKPAASAEQSSGNGRVDLSDARSWD